MGFTAAVDQAVGAQRLMAGETLHRCYCWKSTMARPLASDCIEWNIEISLYGGLI
jgi:hypothetical protein